MQDNDGDRILGLAAPHIFLLSGAYAPGRGVASVFGWNRRGNLRCRGGCSGSRPDARQRALQFADGTIRHRTRHRRRCGSVDQWLLHTTLGFSRNLLRFRGAGGLRRNRVHDFCSGD